MAINIHIQLISPNPNNRLGSLSVNRISGEQWIAVFAGS
jgi:hypothetical protein